MTTPRSRSSSERTERKERPTRRFAAKKIDEFARLKIEPDYKDVARLRKHMTPQGKIQPRRRTGLSAKNQRKLTIAIKRARHMALLPFVND